ncbi:MAG: hypothetical protein WD069_04810 [Planctomycetales bacterium]
MVATMLPIGYGEMRQGHIPATIVAYAAGSLVGAFFLGLSVAGVGALLNLHPSTSFGLCLAILGAIGVVYALVEASILSFPRPQVQRQVPVRWYKALGGPGVGLLYGGILGFGLATRIPFATLYLVVAWAFAVGRPLVAGATLSVYGLGKFMPLALIGPHRGGEGEASDRILVTLAPFEPLIRLANATVLACAGGWSFGLLIRQG